MKDRDQTATATLANGYEQPEPAVTEVEMRDAEPLANGHQARPAKQEQRIEIEPVAAMEVTGVLERVQRPAVKPRTCRSQRDLKAQPPHPFGSGFLLHICKESFTEIPALIEIQQESTGVVE